MHPIIYDVAVSLDGFIAGPDGDISNFAPKGPVVDDYFKRLGGYTTAIMGRKTYEFGYDFGLNPGQNPYPHMDTIVFSTSLELPKNSDVSVRRTLRVEDIKSLKQSAQGPIYLCGGGLFASWFLDNGLIDTLILKRTPYVFAQGVPLFGAATAPHPFERTNTKTYENGYLLEEFERV